MVFLFLWFAGLLVCLLDCYWFTCWIVIGLLVGLLLVYLLDCYWFACWIVIRMQIGVSVVNTLRIDSRIAGVS